MLRLNGEVWRMNPHHSEINVHILQPGRKEQTLSWGLDIECVPWNYSWNELDSGGPPPRTLHLCVNGMYFDFNDWRKLEGVEIESRFNLDDTEAACDLEAYLFISELDAPSAPIRSSSQCSLRFHRREGAYFSIELEAAMNQPARDTARPSDKKFELEREASLPCPVEKNLYLVSEVMFSNVRITVPANAKDPMEYARAFAARYTGLHTYGASRFIPVDFAKDKGDCREAPVLPGHHVVLYTPVDWRKKVSR